MLETHVIQEEEELDHEPVSAAPREEVKEDELDVVDDAVQLVNVLLEMV